MARPLLNTSALRTPTDTGQSGWARGLSQAARGIASGLDKRFDIKRKEQNQFINDMAFDINSVSNDLFKGYAVDQYDKFRENWVSQFKEQKGRLSPEQKIKLQSDMKSLQSSVEYLNGVSKQNDNAMQAQQKDPRVKHKGEEWGQFLELMNKKNIDPEEVKRMGSQFMASDSGIPGTDLVPMDINDAFVNTAPSIKKSLPEKETGVGVETFKKGGEDWEAGYKDISHGTTDDLDGLTYNAWANPKYNVLKNIDKSVLASLSPEEQKAALLEFGDGEGAYAKYALKNKVSPDVKNELIAPTKKYETVNRVPEGSRGSGRGGKGWESMDLTETGVKFGHNPVPISRDIGGTTYKNASVVSINNDNGSYTAQMVVPKDKDYTVISDLQEKAKADNNRELTPEESMIIFKEISSTDKYKTVDVPLEDIYDELERGLTKKKMNVRGYNKISFEDKNAEAAGSWDEYKRN